MNQTIVSLLVASLIVLFGGMGNARGQTAAWISGVTEPASDADLSTSIPGVLGKYYFGEGDAVKKGDVILELENGRERLALQRTRLIVDAARKDYERTKKLYEDSKGISVSKEEFDQKSVALKIALADYDIAAEELSLRQIVAPFDGRIVDLFSLETGEGAKAQTPLVRLVDVSRCVLVCNVPPAAAKSLSKGSEVEVRMGPGGDAGVLKGRIIFVSSVLDPSSGLLKIKAEFENKNAVLKPGFEASMRITGPNAGKGDQANAP